MNKINKSIKKVIIAALRDAKIKHRIAVSAERKARNKEYKASVFAEKVRLILESAERARRYADLMLQQAVTAEKRAKMLITEARNARHSEKDC